MDIQRRRFLSLAGGVASLPVAARVVRAETYPARTVKIIVATAAGGSSDIAARLIAQWLTEKLGQSFFVENRPGGNNNIGTEAAARSPADGYTLFWANSVNTINASLYEKLSYNFIADFAPVVRVIRSPLLMMVHPSVPAKTVPEFIAYAKANPDKISMGSGGHGSSGHMAGELFKMDTGVRMVHLPYRGESLAMTDLLGGQVQIVFATSRFGNRICQGRYGAHTCRDVTRAPRWPAGRAAAGGIPARLRRGGRLERPVRAKEHARRDRRVAQSGDQPRDCRSRKSASVSSPWAARHPEARQPTSPSSSPMKPTSGPRWSSSPASKRNNRTGAA